MSQPSSALFSTRLDQAQRLAAIWHREHSRKGTATPYIVHPFGVSQILDRLGFSEDVLIAGLLHDVVEDAAIDPADIELVFGPEVVRIVVGCSERKRDGAGAARPWLDRKTEHVAELAAADVSTRAVALADKLHNLTSLQTDLSLLADPSSAESDVWARFNAGRESIRWYYQTSIDQLRHGDSRLEHLARACQVILDGVLPS